MFFNCSNTCIKTNQRHKRKKAKNLVKLLFTAIVPVLLFAACSSGDTGKPKSMPTPEAISDFPVTAGPTITPPLKTDISESDEEKNVSSDNSVSDPDANSLDETDSTDNMLKEKSGYVIVLDPGHGGNYTGAIYFGKMEKDLTLQMANYVKEYLLENYEGVEVYFTRDTDIALDKDLKIELENRAIAAKDHDADFFISLHFNASEEHALNGATVYASFREHVAEKSQGMAASILEQLVALGLKNNNVKTRKSADYKAEDGSALDYYAVIRHSAARDIPGLIVEHCFMDNEKDVEFMNTDEKLRELAKADAIGIANYLELKTKTTE